MSDLAAKLQGKIKTYKQQIEEKVRVMRGDSTVKVVDKLGISVSLAIDQRVGIHMRHHNPSGVNTEREVNSASLGNGLLMLGGGLSVVRVEGGHGTVGVGHQLGVTARNKEGGGDQELH